MSKQNKLFLKTEHNGEIGHWVADRLECFYHESFGKELFRVVISDLVSGDKMFFYQEGENFRLDESIYPIPSLSETENNERPENTEFVLVDSDGESERVLLWKPLENVELVYFLNTLISSSHEDFESDYEDDDYCDEDEEMGKYYESNGW